MDFTKIKIRELQPKEGLITLTYIIPSENIILDIPITDSFVAQKWRKWEPAHDEESNSIEISADWTPKQQTLGLMRQRKQHVVDRVYSTYYDEYTVFASFETGKIGYFNNHEYEVFFSESREICLKKIATGEVKVVYDGNFYFTPWVWLMECPRRLGKNHYLGIEWYKNSLRTSPMFIKAHILMAILYFGEKAIYAVEKDHLYTVNHRNLDRYDNRPENLEIILSGENNEHRKVMYQVLKEMIIEVLGYFKGGYWWNKTQSEM